MKDEKKRNTYEEKSKWMVQYKSTVILEGRLRHMTEPDIEYGRYEEIDKKFNEFCEEYESKLVQSPRIQPKRRIGGRMQFGSNDGTSFSGARPSSSNSFMSA